MAKKQKKSLDTSTRKTKWGVPLILTIIVVIIMMLLDWDIDGSVLFFGVYIMITYNVIYYRKLSKRPVVEFVLAQPFGIMGFVLILPARYYNLLLGPAFAFLFGSTFTMMSIFYMLQERDKRKRCDTRTVGTVLDNVKKRTNRESYTGAYSYSPVVEYYADGQRLEVTYGDGFASPMEKGAPVEILYDSREPEEFCFVDEKRVLTVNAAVLVFLGLGILALIASVVLLVVRL